MVMPARTTKPATQNRPRSFVTRSDDTLRSNLSQGSRDTHEGFVSIREARS